MTSNLFLDVNIFEKQPIYMYSKQTKACKFHEKIKKQLAFIYLVNETLTVLCPGRSRETVDNFKLFSSPCESQSNVVSSYHPPRKKHIEHISHSF